MLDYGKYCGDLNTVDCEQGSFFEGTSDVHGKRLVGASQDGALRDQDRMFSSIPAGRRRFLSG